MEHAPIRKRRPVNLTLDAELVAEARDMGLNLSQLCNEAVAAEVKRERHERWKRENQEPIEGWNRWVEVNGLPLEQYRAW